MAENKASILIVDDEESIRSGVSRKLVAEGYACTTAADGKETLEKAASQPFDLVLMDIKMPRMSGMEVLPQILADHPDTGVVMITAIGDSQTAVEAMKLGAYDYVTKPFNVDNLLMRVERALERRKLVIENREYQLHLEQRVEQQVGQIRQYYSEAIQALAREEIALKKLSEAPGATNITESSEFCHEFARALAYIVETRENYSRGHSERVSLLAGEIASQLGCHDELIKDICLAALVHDVGKILIPEHILFKPGRLTSAEYNEVKAHPIYALDILHHVGHFSKILPIIEGHHEWYNGKGYPKNLKGRNIHLGARILSVANAYDAMTSTRPHRPRLNNENAIQLLKKGAGIQWDPVVVDAFLQTLAPTDSSTTQAPLTV